MKRHSHEHDGDELSVSESGFLEDPRYIEDRADADRSSQTLSDLLREIFRDLASHDARNRRDNSDERKGGLRWIRSFQLVAHKPCGNEDQRQAKGDAGAGHSRRPRPHALNVEPDLAFVSGDPPPTSR